ncbi:MAG: helix-turn-helix transcriptional regulator [Elusimicrobia bacterium]|nr:helix-turn-helix transcriptional regulator [Elusimicrobiota bacterium]
MQIAQIRQRKKMTQAQLAKKIGVRQQFVARLENSYETVPSLRTLQKVADALDRHLYVDFR